MRGCFCQFGFGMLVGLGDVHIGVLRGGHCLLLVGLLLKGGSLVEALPVLSWVSALLWTLQLLQCGFILHVTGRLLGSRLEFPHSGPLEFPLFAWVLD